MGMATRRIVVYGGRFLLCCFAYGGMFVRRHDFACFDGVWYYYSYLDTPPPQSICCHMNHLDFI
jgi:hypothetical protein